MRSHIRHIRRALLFVRTHPSVAHGSAAVHDLPLGRYESECGPVTVLERVSDAHGVYFRVELHEPPFGGDTPQEPNEFLHVHVRPEGVVLAPPDSVAPVAYMAPDRDLAREVCDQWLLCDVPVLREHAVQILRWLDGDQAARPPAPAYVLHKNPMQPDTLAIVQFLHSVGINMRPRCCVECNHPPHITELPAIEDDAGNVHAGLRACVDFYELHSGFRGLLDKSVAFKVANPGYRVG